MEQLDPQSLMEPAVDTLPINFAVLGPDGTILETNRAWREFAEANDMAIRPDSIGVNYLEVTAQDSSEIGQRAATGLRAVLEGEKETFSLEYPCHSPDEKQWFMMRAASFSAEGERYVGVAHIDVTDRKRSEIETSRQAETLERQRQQLTLLNRILRHDIRNDVTVILGWSEELREHTSASGQSIVDRIIDAGHHIVDLTKTVRASVETMAEGEDPETKPMPLEGSLRHEIRKTESRYPSAVIDVRGTLPSVTVQANELISSVFRNILNNAIQHNDKETARITVRAEQENGTVRVSFEDNGPGIPPSEREAVLGRSDAGLDHSSAGLGLHLVDMLMTSYGGSVSIEDGESEGAMFVLEFPIVDRG